MIALRVISGLGRRRIYRSLNWQDLEIQQFSGLGHANHLTSRQMAAILKYLWDHPKEYAVLGQGLSIPPFLSASPIASYIQVKTGTLVGVSAISGYLFSSTHRPLAFFIASHNPQEISNLLVAAGNRSPFSSAAQRQWQQQTRQFQKELLEYWFRTH
ncbi:MAG: D-alanyl-D-alanine carboxypeptidase [Rhodospirillaceae bacterium]|nr:D-alanyl-D-alanine carboxypeptidase [Rhodospirillaceae bacterium]